MPTYDSPHWVTVDEEGRRICKKHMLPCVPCPACMANGGDEDLEVTFSESDLTFAAWEEIPLQDLVAGSVDLTKVNVYP